MTGEGADEILLGYDLFLSPEFEDSGKRILNQNSDFYFLKTL